MDFYVSTLQLRPGGIRGDGSTDRTEEIQALLDAVQNDGGTKGGGRIQLPSGDFVISDSLVVAHGAVFAGNGPRATTITLADNSNVPMIVNKSYGGSPEVFGQVITICDMHLDGNAANQSSSSAHGIQFRGTGSEQLSGEDYYDFRHVLDCVMIDNVKGSGVVAASRGEHRYTNVWVKGARQYGVKPTYDTWMTNCTVEHSGRAGFYLDSYAGYCFMSFCRSFWNGRDAWAVSGTSHGFHIESATRCQIVGCSSQDNQDYGLLMDSGSNYNQIVEMQLLNNCVSKSGDDRVGIDMWGASYNRITGMTNNRSVSHTASNQTYSIRMRGSATGNYAHLSHDSSSYHPSNHVGSGNTITVLG